MSENPGSKLPAEQRSLLDQDPASWPDALLASGDAGVDRVLESLASLPQTPTAEHLARYEEVSELLSAELAAGPDEAGSET